jgi:hypothetical protein
MLSARDGNMKCEQKLVDFYSDIDFYFSAWEITSTLKDKRTYNFAYSVTIANGIYVAYINDSPRQSSSLIAQLKNGICLDDEVAFSLNNREGHISQHKFNANEYSSRLMGVSLCFSSFVPGCILAGSSAYSHLHVNFTMDSNIFDTEKCSKEFLLLLAESGQIRQAKYALGGGEVYIKNTDQ